MSCYETWTLFYTESHGAVLKTTDFKPQQRTVLESLQAGPVTLL